MAFDNILLLKKCFKNVQDITCKILNVFSVWVLQNLYRYLLFVVLGKRASESEDKICKEISLERDGGSCKPLQSFYHRLRLYPHTPLCFFSTNVQTIIHIFQMKKCFYLSTWIFTLCCSRKCVQDIAVGIVNGINRCLPIHYAYIYRYLCRLH